MTIIHMIISVLFTRNIFHFEKICLSVFCPSAHTTFLKAFKKMFLRRRSSLFPLHNSLIPSHRHCSISSCWFIFSTQKRRGFFKSLISTKRMQFEVSQGRTEKGGGARLKGEGRIFIKMKTFCEILNKRGGEEGPSPPLCSPIGFTKANSFMVAASFESVRY